MFAHGDAWYRTGDLMRKDAGGFFYFVDRIGDTFRWKGENVATSEVAAAITAFPGVSEANVYGVHVPGTEGAAGMAAIVADGALDLAALRAAPGAAAAGLRPAAVPAHRDRIDDHRDLQAHQERICSARVTIRPRPATRSISTIRQNNAFVPLDAALYARINAGATRF